MKLKKMTAVFSATALVVSCLGGCVQARRVHQLAKLLPKV